MEIYPMLTGSQLRQYLHISTRKLKYLMDHNYIPHEDTGQATYRYRVRWEDAVAFKQRMDTDPSFLSELVGMFNTHCPAKPKPKPEPVLKPTQKTVGCSRSGSPSAGPMSRTPCPPSGWRSCWDATHRRSTAG